MIISQRRQAEAEIYGRLWDMFDFCSQHPSFTAVVPHTTVDLPNPFVLLCPYFFEEQPPAVYGNIPPASVGGRPASNCLAVSTISNKFKKDTPRGQPTGYGLLQYRMWILLEELAHLYSRSSTGKNSLDYYNINRCVKMTPDEALLNGPSYPYYAASEFHCLVELRSAAAGQY